MPSSAGLETRLENDVTSLLKEGRYGSRTEILREGLRLVEERGKRLSLLGAAPAREVADANRATPAEDVKARLIARDEKLSGPVA
ncbi:type II toxin-antitoxin system ParD family antitoxin [Methylobacterium sp. AMS5]|uniref:ribbon-helix-helix domain-containing protein n=1 Tax=Methylobacterium sp. AMS5 TaxID=925818 RepID=UPI00074F9426|nr:type II toxin-antitoxin system ParD family antitoxin [Methylobacterium sp. AMS5]AMB46293.1 addiction module antitoxin [Methylobacterium sp. AMS5]